MKKLPSALLLLALLQTPAPVARAQLAGATSCAVSQGVPNNATFHEESACQTADQDGTLLVRIEGADDEEIDAKFNDGYTTSSGKGYDAKFNVVDTRSDTVFDTESDELYNTKSDADYVRSNEVDDKRSDADYVRSNEVDDNPSDAAAHQYHEMPQLFQLDAWEACLSSHAHGVYCLGDFALEPQEDDPNALRLFERMKAYSLDRHHYNRTLLHRGVCVSRCDVIDGDDDDVARFSRCVDAHTRASHGLRARLVQLQYCRRGNPKRPIDAAETAFAVAVAMILLLNVAGTAYDLLRDPNAKHNKYADKYLLAWSVRRGWRRLTADYSDGDPRLAQLAPVHGIKVVTLLLVMMAHTVIVTDMAYLHNPGFVETASRHPLTMLLHNGSVVVQGFVTLAGFLFAYNLLLLAEKHPGKHFSLLMLPYCILHRVCRILPMQLFATTLMGTWWARAGDGPQWVPLVQAEADRCRRKWWTHLFFANNFVQVHDKCLIQSWFLAVDMQVYVATAVVTLLLLRRPRLALRVLPLLVLASCALNTALAMRWGLKPILMTMNPETIRQQWSHEPSFEWLYAAPWASLPAAMMGVFYAFLHRHMQVTGADMRRSKVLMFVYRWFLPLLILWILCGHFVNDTHARWAAALYAGVDRAGYCAIGLVALMGFFHDVDSVCRRFFAWRGWRPLSRASLPALLLHWHFALLQPAIGHREASMSVLEIGGQWYNTIFLTYMCALPLYVLLEAPAQATLQALLLPTANAEDDGGDKQARDDNKQAGGDVKRASADGDTRANGVDQRASGGGKRATRK